MKTINILGVNYTYIVADEVLIIKDMEEVDGVCNVFDKEIIIRNPKYIGMDARENKEAIENVIRHEVVHAVMYESGLIEYDDERLVDWVARMIPKIEAIFNEIKNEKKDEETK